MNFSLIFEVYMNGHKSAHMYMYTTCMHMYTYTTYMHVAACGKKPYELATWQQAPT